MGERRDLMKFAKVLFLAGLILLAATSAYGTVEGPKKLPAQNTTSGQESMDVYKAGIYLSLGVLAFGLVLVIFTGIVALKKKEGWDKEATRIFTVSVIVTAGLFLITAGYTDQQIAPMFGLLGTIVGYLLGKSSQNEEKPSSTP
jgi:hypothetical protein